MGFAQIVVELQPKVNVFAAVLIRRANAKRVVLVPAICPAKLEEVMQIKKIDNSCLIQGDCIYNRIKNTCFIVWARAIFVICTFE